MKNPNKSKYGKQLCATSRQRMPDAEYFSHAVFNPFVVRALVNLFRQKGINLDVNGHVWEYREHDICPNQCRFCEALSGADAAISPCKGDISGIGPHNLSLPLKKKKKHKK